MAYVRKQWGGANTVPTIDDFNRMEQGIADAHSHMARNDNPHGVTAGQINAVPTTRTLATGTGLSGGGALSVNRTLNLDFSYLDGRYLGKTSKASDSDKLDGLHASAFMKVNSTFLDMGNNDGIHYDDGAGAAGEFYFEIDSSKKRALHSGNVTASTNSPSSSYGVNGNIHIEY